MMPAKPGIIAPAHVSSCDAIPGSVYRSDSLGGAAHTLCAVTLFKSASTVSLLTLASPRVTGLVRDLLMASVFRGQCPDRCIQRGLPGSQPCFRRLFAEGAFSQAFVPVLATTKAQSGDEATERLIASVATALAWVLVLTCWMGCWAPLLVWALASGLGKAPRAYDAAVLMTRWMFPYIGFMSMVALSAGVLNTWKHFAARHFTQFCSTCA